MAADGVVLGPALLSGSLPTVADDGDAAPPGARAAATRSCWHALTRPRRRAARRCDGSSRASTRAREGLTVAMRNGLLVYFGDATRPHAKWLSLARVLADPSSAGATYIDVRLPGGRPRASRAGVRVPPKREPGAGDGRERASPNRPSAALAAGLTAGTPRNHPAAATNRAGAGLRSSEASHDERIGAKRPKDPLRAPACRKRPRGEPPNQEVDNLKPQPEVDCSRRRFSGTGREFRDLQRLLRDWTPSLTGRSSLHNVRNPAVRRPVCCATLNSY